MDLTSLVAGAINSWFSALATALLLPALAAVGELLFRTPDFAAIPAVRDTWHLVRSVTDALFVLAWLGAGLLVMTRGDADARYTAKILIERGAFAAVLANASLFLCGELIALNNAIVTAVLGPSAAATIAESFGALLASGQVTTDIVGVLVALVAAVLAALLVALFIGRALILLVATALAPLALATYALPNTDEIARLWWRVFVGLLFVQVLQALLVRIALGVLAGGTWLGGPTSTLVSGLVVITLLYALLRLPFAAYAWAFRAPLIVPGPLRVVGIGARLARVLA